VARGPDLGVTGRQPRAVQSALALLQEVARAGAGVTAKEISSGLGLPPATTYRLLNLLVAEEYLVRLPDLHGFALGHKVADLWAATGQARMPTAVREVVSELRATIRHGVHLVTYGPTSLHCSDVDPDHPLLSVDLIERFLHATAVGQLLLAEQPSWRDLMPRGRLQQLTPNTLVTFGDLDLHLQRIQGAPYVAQNGQLHADVSCLAVPIRSPEGTLVASLAVSTSTTHATALNGALNTLVGGAKRLSPLLG
jgi:DNA-binding IclR family transcriptional regulator